MDICARVDMNVGISFVLLSIVNANECVRIVSDQHMGRNAGQKEVFFARWPLR